MRCPYCGGLNSEQAGYCRYCGRDLTKPPKQPSQSPPPPPPPYQQGRPAPPVQGNPSPSARQQPPYQRQQPVPPTQGRSAPIAPPPPPRTRDPIAPVAPPSPEAPAPFPPHTMDQLRTLEQGALPFTVMDTTTNGTRKKIVRVIYPKCVAWQQSATLLKAFKEQQETRFESIVIQGYLSQDPDVYSFTNGQLSFDRDVRLGSQIMNRYQIETGNGFETDSVRIVLTE